MSKGYRLHFEGNEGEATACATMAAVRQIIRDEAKKAGVTIAKATQYAYIMTEADYLAEQEGD